ncbi:hypothetical protein LZ017_06920 [Pelomonas sp. CA6]|uniref:hypothetical protein n=1 Tax=Pelomonas sp. CA6 TaxID=2907999 RepID=UPI001F4BFD17|nr:hypothetical protein [Pelomonas sp. CA6]MCH7343110.1 hypothetical protein [Pelomonas sp. CA6]
MNVGDLFPAEGTHRNIYCDKCSTHLELGFLDFEDDVSGVHIHIEGLPQLRCPACQSTFLPDRSRFALIETHRQALEKRSSAVNVVRKKTNQNFGFTEVPFLYDSDDYHYIPGLRREFDPGFLTPVFFNKEALLKYDAHPSYRVDFASRTYGTIRKDDFDIAFGINRNGRLVMWLGDIATLPESEQFYLRSENIASDHSIGSEFYDGQIECIFTERTPEDRLFEQRSRFLEAFFAKFGVKAAHLEKEVLDLAISIRRPVVDTPAERRHIADALNKVYLESLDNKALAKALDMVDRSHDGIRSLKRLERLLESTMASPVEAATTVAPLFVLYDLRVAYSHLGSVDEQAQIVTKVIDRLGIAGESADLFTIYDALVTQLRQAFEKMASALQ